MIMGHSGGLQTAEPEDVLTIEYVRVVKSLFLAKENVLYTIDTHQCEALLICRQMLLFS